MWALFIAGTITLLSSCHVSTAILPVTINDTAVVYKKDTLLLFNTFPAVSQCSFDKTALQNKSQLKTLLVLGNPKLSASPEGAYEIYITAEPLTDKPSSPQNGFVNVLDVYSLTAPDAKKELEVDISDAVKKLFSPKKTISSLYLTIRFGPIKLADGTYSAKAGELHINGIKILQIQL